jgi:hypothetical protein
MASRSGLPSSRSVAAASASTRSSSGSRRRGATSSSRGTSSNSTPARLGPPLESSNAAAVAAPLSLVAATGRVEAGSVRLSCLANATKMTTAVPALIPMIHSVVWNEQMYTLVSKATTTTTSSTIVTPLPSYVQSLLQIHPPVELLAMTTTTTRAQRNQDMLWFPPLLLYSRQACFVLQISAAATAGKEEIVGQVVQVSEPLVLRGQLIRIRVADQGWAALQQNGSEYSITLYHAAAKRDTMNDDSEGRLTTPLCFNDDTGIVDFVWGGSSSSEVNVWAPLSLVFLHANATLSVACPVVLNGTSIPRRVWTQALADLDRSANQDAATWRQRQAAICYLRDVFVPDDHNRLCARLGAPGATENAAHWPTQRPTPILSGTPNARAVLLETALDQDGLLGLVLVSQLHVIELAWALLATNHWLPRFALERPADAALLDQHAAGLARVVERVQFPAPATTARSIDDSQSNLVVDPIQPHLFHYVTPRAIRTVSTNALSAAAQKILSSTAAPVRTVAWLSLTSATPVTGVVVPPAEASEQHCLVAQLRHGSSTTLPVTAMLYRHELEQCIQTAAAATKSRQPLLLLEQDRTAPFYQTIEPLVQKVNQGLARSITRIVHDGSSRYTDITAEELAVVIHVKDQCNQHVMLPLLELRETVAAHYQHLRDTVIPSQQQQARTVLEKMARLRRRLSMWSDSMTVAQENAQTLVSRSRHVLSLSRDWLPQVTAAELDFYQQMQVLQAKCQHYQEQTQALSTMLQKLRLPGSTSSPHGEGNTPHTPATPTGLDEESVIANAHDMLRSNETILQATHRRVASVDRSMAARLSSLQT